MTDNGYAGGTADLMDGQLHGGGYGHEYMRLASQIPTDSFQESSRNIGISNDAIIAELFPEEYYNPLPLFQRQE